MKTFTPYAEGNGFTQLDNSLIDYVMPSVNPSDWVIICFVVRKTRGWHKDSDALSLTQMEAGTGLSRPTVVSSLKRLTEQGHLSRVDGIGTISNRYGLNPDFVISTDEGEGLKKLTSKEILPVSSKESLPLSSKKSLHTKETPKQTKKERDTPPPAPKLAPHEANMLARQERYSPTMPKPIKALCEALETVTQSLNAAKVEETAYTLYGYEVTPAELLTLYGGATCYWRRVDWRGQKGNRPELGNITGTIMAAREWLQNGGAAETEKATEATALYRQWIAPLAEMNGSARDYFKGAPSQVKRALSTNGMGNIDQIKRVTEQDFAGWYAGVKA